jgi:hypothetical protein
MIRLQTAAVVIYSAAILHTAEALIIAGSNAADSSVGIASLFVASEGQRAALVAVMLLASLLAVMVVARGPGQFAIFALLPQQALLITTALGALYFAGIGHYADGYIPAGGHLFIFADQLPRILFAATHAVAFYHWLWLNDATKRSKNAVDKIIAEVTWVSQPTGDDEGDKLLLIDAGELREIVAKNLPIAPAG